MKNTAFFFMLAALLGSTTAQAECQSGFGIAAIKPGSYGAVDEKVFREMLTPVDGQYDKTVLGALVAKGAVVALPADSGICAESGDHPFHRTQVHIPGRADIYWVRLSDLSL